MYVGSGICLVCPYGPFCFVFQLWRGNRVPDWVPPFYVSERLQLNRLYTVPHRGIIQLPVGVRNESCLCRWRCRDGYLRVLPAPDGCHCCVPASARNTLSQSAFYYVGVRSGGNVSLATIANPREHESLRRRNGHLPTIDVATVDVVTGVGVYFVASPRLSCPIFPFWRRLFGKRAQVHGLSH